MALLNGNMDENYFRSIIKNIGYIYNDLFDQEDIELIEQNTFFDADEDDFPNELTSQGLTKSDAKNLETTIWQEWDNNVSHTFEKIYSKLICCLGNKSGTKKNLALSIPVYRDGQIVLDKRTYSITNAEETCNFSGNNFYDDNSTSGGYNSSCEHLMNKYCLFLQKYDPENPLIDNLCGCILGKKYITEEMPAMLESQNAAALSQVLGQRNCGIGKCIKENAYRRSGDRGQCVSQINICSNTLAVSDVETGSTEFKNINLSNDCGGTNTAAPTNNVDVPLEAEADVSTTDGQEFEDQSEPTDSTAADSTAADSTTADSTTADSTAPYVPKPGREGKMYSPDGVEVHFRAADSTEELGFFEKFIIWFNSLFGFEGFSSMNNEFDKIYSLFSIIVIYILIFKDPLKIQKKVQKMF